MMTRAVTIAVSSIVLLGVFAGSHADEADAVVGQWLTDGGDARIEIFKEGATYGGKIVWLKEPTYDAKDKEAGKPVHDRENPDPSQRDQPMLGLRLLKGFQYGGENTWERGTIYNAENGKTYKAKLALQGPDKLKVRGFIGISLIGGNTIWTRYAAPGDGKDAAEKSDGKAPAKP